ncbi:HAMP domain-containing sensor histidine kinase [Bifidobacterium sp. SO1]|uniref:sensor histidine kinase n=1 Tax=Bifidobacterium sp. SO1 TaxID=2809029 RepID=UPI001BDD2D3C|nr:HAMP domain-containing sensor histidine kinase [Bifidobacterium sp. SO1]MBT1161666.1 HAMP domain-containing histidine kinase [Bifidobacterium sp. SO1]
MNQQHATHEPQSCPRVLRPSRWSTRGRLTATIVVAFLLLTTAVTAGTFLIVDRQLSTITVGGIDTSTDSESADKSLRQPSSNATDGDESGYTSIHVNEDRGDGLSLKATAGDDRTRDLILATTIAPILVFGVLAAILTWTITTNSQKRINMVARQITTADGPLSARHAVSIPERNDEATTIANAYNAMLHDLNDSIERERQFIANASHELKNPLAATSAALEIPLDAGLFDDATRPFVRKALDANRSGTALVLRLLELARIQHLDHTDLTRIDLADVVSDVLDKEHDALAPLTVTASLAPATLQVDRILVSQLAMNLILNAAQHNIPGGSIDITTATSHDDGNDYATLTIANTGKDLTRIDPTELLATFNRGPDSRISNRHGTPNHGLGLSICDEIVRLHHGTMNLHANPHGGLTVTVRLPDTNARRSMQPKPHMDSAVSSDMQPVGIACSSSTTTTEDGGNDRL